MNFTGIPSGPVALSEISEVLFCVTDDLMAITLG